MPSRFTTPKIQTGSSRFTKPKATTESAGFTTPQTTDLSTNEGLTTIAKKAGLENQAETILNPKPKLSFLQRLGAGLGAFETGSAVYEGVKTGSVLRGASKYVSDIGKGLASAITGRDLGYTEKK